MVSPNVPKSKIPKIPEFPQLPGQYPDSQILRQCSENRKGTAESLCFSFCNFHMKSLTVSDTDTHPMISFSEREKFIRIVMIFQAILHKFKSHALCSLVLVYYLVVLDQAFNLRTKPND